MMGVSHQWGSDLTLGPDGDLAIASGTLLGQQRILRRLLTNPGDYIWHLDYGAGLGRFVGSPATPLYTRAVVRTQIFKEATVARNPEPVIDINTLPSGGGFCVRLQYTDGATGYNNVLNFPVGVLAK